MNPRRVHATNFRTYETLDLEIPYGCTAILGQNGAGKSSIVQLLDLALFGAQGRSLADYLTVGCDEPLEIGCEFEHAGALYRVRRSYSPRGRGTSKVDFERWEEHYVQVQGVGDMDPDEYPAQAWMPLTRETAKATDELIEQTLGLSRDTFRASAFLAQGDGAAFCEAQPRDRKAILADILGLDVYDRLGERARSDRRSVESELQRIAGALEAADAQLATRPQVTEIHEAAGVRADECEHAHEDAAAEHQRISEQHAAIQTRAAEFMAAVSERDRLTAERDRLQAQADAARAAREEILTLEDELAVLTSDDDVERIEADLAALNERLAAHARAVAEHEARKREAQLKEAQRATLVAQTLHLGAQAAAARQKAVELERAGPGTSACDHCGQTLGAEALASRVARLRVDADEFDAAAADVQAQADTIELSELGDPPAVDPALAGRIDAARQALAAARAHQLRAASLRERRDLLQQTVAGWTDETQVTLDTAAEAASGAAENAARLAAALPSADGIEALKAELAQARRAVDAAHAALDAAKAARVRARAELDRLEQLEETVAINRVGRDELQGRVDLLALAERAFGRDGIPALIVESVAVPQIESEANRILAELGTSFTVELRTQRAQKTTETLKEVLDIVVSDGTGARPYETFSGGERTRLNLALRIALARLLANRRGAESRVLVIDEPDGLDESGMARLADVLRRLLSEFERILLVSHVPALRDAFDQAITVVKDEDGRSRVESGAPVAVVA